MVKPTWFALTFLALSACDTTPLKPSDDAGADAERICDHKKDCNACEQCASQRLCARYASACYQSAACNGLGQCMQLCGQNMGCKTECYRTNAAGYELYEAWSKCLYCEQCTTDCAGYRSCS